MRNLHQLFVLGTASQIICGDLANFVAVSEYMNFSHPNKQGMFASKTQDSTTVITLLYVIQGSIKKRMSKSVRFTTAAVNIGIAFFLKEQFS